MGGADDHASPPKAKTLTPLSVLGFGCSRLESQLGGGIPVGMVTELVGEATAGKSQLCTQLMLQCQLPISRRGLEARALYIYTEGKPATKRIAQMAALFAEKEHLSWDPIQRIVILKGIATPDDITRALRSCEHLLARPDVSGLPRVRLVVLDSAANVFRDVETSGPDEAQATTMGERASRMFEVVAELKRIAFQHSAAVVVTNQVKDYVPDFVATNLDPVSSSLVTSRRRVVPALGLAWSSCVNQRLFLSRGTPVGENLPPGVAVQRRIQVVFSPYLPSTHADFVIIDDGIRGADRM